MTRIRIGAYKPVYREQPSGVWSPDKLTQVINVALQEKGLAEKGAHDMLGTVLIAKIRTQFAKKASLTHAKYKDIKIPRKDERGDDVIVEYGRENSPTYGIRVPYGQQLADAYIAWRQAAADNKPPKGYLTPTEFAKMCRDDPDGQLRNTTAQAISKLISHIRRKLDANPEASEFNYNGVWVPRTAIVPYKNEDGVDGYAIQSDIAKQIMAALKEKTAHRLYR